MFLRVIGSIPVPIVMGAILDRTCAVWSFECGKVGACQLYDNPRLSLSLGILIAGIKVRTQCMLLLLHAYIFLNKYSFINVLI